MDPTPLSRSDAGGFVYQSVSIATRMNGTRWGRIRIFHLMSSLEVP